MEIKLLSPRKDAIKPKAYVNIKKKSAEYAVTHPAQIRIQKLSVKSVLVSFSKHPLKKY